mmetsp:Transcript_34774/g.62009  ORF Transcript_34774/g.62009 Transcript_34774/m.62009 type:complete len:168 (-) Transcript_34774:110-613(-)
MVLALASTARAAVQSGGIAVRSHARQTPRASPASSFLAGRSLRSATSNRTEIKTAAFFNFGKKNNDYNAGGSAREEYEPEDVEFYFNYMGCLATEGTYDRMYELMKDRHPCDVILLMAAKEGDVPKIMELLDSGADIKITDNDGKSPLELCTKPDARELLEQALAKA